MQIKIDKLIRSKRRTIALIIERDGSFTVRAPMRAPNTAIETFIQQKADWITRTREKVISMPVEPTLGKQYIDGEKFLFLGSYFDLKLVGLQKPSLHFDNGFTLSRAAQTKSEQIFTRWYKERALEIIAERGKKYEQQYKSNDKDLHSSVFLSSGFVWFKNENSSFLFPYQQIKKVLLQQL